MRNSIFLLAIFFAIDVHSQTTFQKIYKNLNQDAYGKGYCLTNDGNYMIVCQQADMFSSINYLVKVDPFGNVLWRRDYEGLDGFSSIIQTRDGGYAISTSTDSLLGDFDMCILKIDSFGNVQWCKLYGLGVSLDFPSKLIQDPNGAFLLTGGGINNLTTARSAIIVKTDSSGNLLWDKIVDGPGSAYLSHASFTNDGGIIVTGTYSTSIVSGLWMMKLDSSGQTSWSHCYGNTFYGTVSFQTNDGGYITSGSGHSPGIPEGYMLLKSDSNGNVQWCKVYSDAISVPDLIINADGDYVMAGTHQNGINDSANVYLIKTNTLGDTVWTRFYEIDTVTYRGESGNSILQTPDGGYLVGGQAVEYQSSYTDIYLLKTDANGNAGCNLVHHPITIESIVPSIDTSVMIRNGIIIASIIPASAVSQITDTTLCLHDWINEYENIFSLDVYPNPATDQIMINTSAFSEPELMLEVKDVLGRNIIRRKVYQGNLQLDVSNISRGIYLIGLTGKESFGRSTFYKQ